nr:crossover junction endodeoxyribonuclease RuvC [Streptomyces taklimakanensis]
MTRCGIGVVEGTAGRPLRMVGVGVVRTPAETGTAERLVLVERGVEEWLEEHRPDVVAVERVFSQHNVRTVMGTAQASAVAMLCAARRGLPVVLHTPSEVKAAVTGTGRAEKAQVSAMVARLLRLDSPPRPADAADALALAICHIWRAPAHNRLQQAHERQLRLGRARSARPGHGDRPDLAGRAVPADRADLGTPADRSSAGPAGPAAPSAARSTSEDTR